MRRWRLPVVVLTVAALSTLGIRHVFEKRVLEKRAQQTREVAYQSAVRSYSEVLRPGMSRKEVEDYLRAKNVRFRLMCCVDIKESSKDVYDELTKVGQKILLGLVVRRTSTLLSNSLAPSENEARWDLANDSDKLKAVTLYRWLEGCL
jgi:hypothetical protein